VLKDHFHFLPALVGGTNLSPACILSGKVRISVSDLRGRGLGLFLKFSRASNLVLSMISHRVKNKTIYKMGLNDIVKQIYSGRNIGGSS